MDQDKSQEMLGFLLAAAIFLVMWAFRYEKISSNGNYTYMANRWTGNIYLLAGTQMHRVQRVPEK
jgi:hypothetical protein